MATTVRFKKNKKGKVSIYLDMHYFGQRKFLSLNLTFPEKPSNAFEKNQKRNAIELAKTIAYKKHVDIISNNEGIICVKAKQTCFFEYFQNYISEKVNEKQKRNFSASFNKLKEFHKSRTLPCNLIDTEFLNSFSAYLLKSLNGSSPYTYFKRFRQVLKYASSEGYVSFDNNFKVRIPQNNEEIKDVLTFEELQILVQTPCGNNQVKKAFLFACLTGLRYCDIKQLIWANVKSDRIELVQSKTRKIVSIVLHDNAKKLLGSRLQQTNLVFSLPSHTSCLRTIKKWVKKASIEKHITFHCARHSFGSNLTISGTDIYVISKLLGHTSIKHTTRYTRYSDTIGKTAISKLPNIL